MCLDVINTGGGWGIPLSIVMILYALISGVSVGKMFAAGILLMVLTATYILIRSNLQPHLAPAL